ncbi:MAG: hypothetical protein IT427_01960 [Pirellulales bacterium]|nr:hypothetical protein [Pirellulales bacterium]
MILTVIRYRLSTRAALCVWCAIATASWDGCSKGGPERVIVSGMISHNGKAIPHGIIRFTPNDNVPGSTVAATIADGKYRVESRGGVPVGTHKIQIEAYRLASGTPKTNAPGARSIPNDAQREQYLPDKYNKRTSLEFIVDSQHGEITKNFELAD